ncbi:glycosyltransferase family 4 protein [Tardiphaga sp. 866_E4_N2_1]|uniref:glycosyltransferase family 4 protein n=1 Tax=unclassified Tardiphaga TaxID=2631404 RepID=UPI003F20D479
MSLPRKALFLYLGRRGALCRLTLELARDAVQLAGVQSTFVVSKMSENIADFAPLGDAVLPIETFDRAMSFANVRNFLAARKILLDRIARDDVSVVVTLMPHIWTPLLAPAIRARGAKYVTIIHDAVGHPGDPTGPLIPWLRSEARSADRVVTLSRAVADQMTARRFADPAKVTPLFLPDLRYDSKVGSRTLTPGKPLRLLFLGRILKYKGLPLLLDALDILRSDGLHVDLGVAGSGDIGAIQERLDALQAEVINRWLGDDEIAPLLARYDAMALPYTEASQSGVAATAFGSLMPVVAMPSGGLSEQVRESVTGVIASDVTAGSLAQAIRRLATDPVTYQQIATSLKQTAPDRSMRQFIVGLLKDIA